MDTAEVSLVVKNTFDTVMFYCNFKSGTFRLKVDDRYMSVCGRASIALD